MEGKSQPGAKKLAGKSRRSSIGKVRMEDKVRKSKKGTIIKKNRQETRIDR